VPELLAVRRRESPGQPSPAILFLTIGLRRKSAMNAAMMSNAAEMN